MTSGRRFGPDIFRHFFLADIISLKTIARAVFSSGIPWSCVCGSELPLIYATRLGCTGFTVFAGFGPASAPHNKRLT